MSRGIVIVNSKCYRTRKSNKALVKRLQQGFGFEVLFSDYTGHCPELARRLSGYELIIVLGGDGTISEIVNSMDLGKQRLAIVPIGTGNSLARDLNIASAERALGSIRRNRVSEIDIIEILFSIKGEHSSRYAVATTGIGFSAEVASFANRRLKNLGVLSYAVSACCKLFNQRSIKADFQFDDSLSERVSFTNFILNNTKYAGNFLVFPDADIRDSMADLLYSRTRGVTQYLWNISIITKANFYRPEKRMRTRGLSIRLEEPSPLMIDGEIVGPVEKLRYSVAAKRLKVLN